MGVCNVTTRLGLTAHGWARFVTHRVRLGLASGDSYRKHFHRTVIFLFFPAQLRDLCGLERFFAWEI
jgi:hypothetical protein